MNFLALCLNNSQSEREEKGFEKLIFLHLADSLFPGELELVKIIKKIHNPFIIVVERLFYKNILTLKKHFLIICMQPNTTFK